MFFQQTLRNKNLFFDLFASKKPFEIKALNWYRTQSYILNYFILINFLSKFIK